MMMKIAIGTIFYNNAPELKRLLDSLPTNDSIDYFIGIDGIFKYVKEKYPDLPDLSTDMSKELIYDYHDFVDNCATIYVPCPNTTEYEKRNTYLETCEQLDDVDVLIIVDTDEYFKYEPYETKEEAWQRFKKNLEFEIRKYKDHNVFGINFIDEVGTKTYKPRIWVKPSEMRYIYGSHYHYANVKREQKDIELFKSQNICYLQQAQAIVKGLTLAHDHSLRSQEYQKRREQYQRYLVRYEELVQSHKVLEQEAHKLAKESPDKDFVPN